MHEKQRPSVGRNVHYQAYGTPNGEYPSVPRAAIVTEVYNDHPEGPVGLAVTVYQVFARVSSQNFPPVSHGRFCLCPDCLRGVLGGAA